ncbi:hypothetical protein SU32_16335 [Ahrensia marina]|uniref:DNA-packaging protein n=1 Tax=Ahrensia marina TaxID=1514904 RepID=A0A0N0VL76_9HYPH|nr:hypothetical protein SU32_16335 [Ahrensia marina]
MSTQQALDQLYLKSSESNIIERKIAAAQAHIERLLGYTFEEQFEGEENTPEDLKEAVLQLVGHWYENREATLVGVTAQELPFSVWQIIAENRAWSFS